MHSRPFGNPLFQPLLVYINSFLVIKKPADSDRRTAFREKERRKVDCFVLDNDILLFDHLIERHDDELFLHAKKLRCRCGQLLSRCEAMPQLRKLIERVHNSASESGIPLTTETHFLRYDVRRPKTDSPYIVRKPIRIFLHGLNALIAIGLENLSCMGSRHIMALQKQHNVFDFLLLCPAFFDALHAELPDTRNLNQNIRIFFDDFQRLFSELIHNLLGKFRSDSLNQTTTEILFDSEYGRRKRLLPSFHRELPSVLGIHPPAAAELQHAPHMYIRHCPNDRHKVRIAFRPALDDRIAVFLILICNPLYYAPELLHCVSFLSCAPTCTVNLYISFCSFLFCSFLLCSILFSSGISSYPSITGTHSFNSFVMPICCGHALSHCLHPIQSEALPMPSTTLSYISFPFAKRL